MHKDVNLAKVINDNNAFSAYWLVIKARHMHEINSKLTESWFSRLSRGNFRSVYANYSVSFFDFFNNKFLSSESFKNDLLKVKHNENTNEWGKVWKLFHPFYTDDVEERSKKDNDKFLLALIKDAGTDLTFLLELSASKKIDLDNPSELAEACEKYSRCAHLCDYINALAAGSSEMSRSKLFDAIFNRTRNHEHYSENDTLELIHSQL